MCMLSLEAKVFAASLQICQGVSRISSALPISLSRIELHPFPKHRAQQRWARPDGCWLFDFLTLLVSQQKNWTRRCLSGWSSHCCDRCFRPMTIDAPAIEASTTDALTTGQTWQNIRWMSSSNKKNSRISQSASSCRGARRPEWTT